MTTNHTKEHTMTIMAYELRPGDRIRLEGLTRTVEHVHVGSETRVTLTGSAFPTSFIVWGDTPCKLV